MLDNATTIRHRWGRIVLATAVATALVFGEQPALEASASAPVGPQAAVLAGGSLPTKLASRPSAKPGPKLHQIKITWKGANKRTKMWVNGSDGYTGLLKRSTRFSAGVKRTGSTTGIVTVPSKYRARMGGNTGRLVYLYIWARNGKSTKKSPMVVSRSGVKKALGTSRQQLKIATYNVAAIPGTAKIKGQKWSKRRNSVVNAITKANPDLIAVQEAGLSWTGYPRSTGRFQAMDLRALLAKKGYVMNVNEAQIRAVMQGKYSRRQMTSWLFYKKSTVSMLATGIRSSGGKAKVDRYFSWGKFRSKKNGKIFYAASVHLETGGSSKAQTIRARQINNWASFMSKKAGRSPVFIAGDYNTDFRAERNSATQRLVAKGWQDASATNRRSGFQYSSTNDKPKKYKGYAPKPTKDRLGQGGKIDHILSKNTSGVFRYVNQVVLKRGRFVEKYRGSDHNLQWAVIGIR